MTASPESETRLPASPASPTRLPARLPSLTGYRVILFLAVFLTHALGAGQFFADSSVNELGTIAPYGVAALSVFFVLSGFVLTWQEPWNDKVRLFWRRRAMKIFPGHIVTWAATLIMLAVVGQMTLIGRSGTGPAVANLFLVQAWIPEPSYMLSVYGVNWSVSCEVAFYLTLPLLIRPLLRIPTQRLWACFAGLTVVIVALPAVIDAAINEPPWSYWAPLSFHEAWLVYFFPLARLPEFLLGVVLARIVQTGRWPGVRVWWVVLYTIVVWQAIDFLPATYASSGVLAIAVCLFVPLVAVRDIEGRSRWFNRKPLVVLGNATYATYLVHFPLLGAARELLGGTRRFDTPTGALIVATLFAVTLLVGLALYKYVEQPLLRRFSTPTAMRTRHSFDPAGRRPF